MPPPANNPRRRKAIVTGNFNIKQTIGIIADTRCIIYISKLEHKVMQVVSDPYAYMKTTMTMLFPHKSAQVI